MHSEDLTSRQAGQHAGMGKTLKGLFGLASLEHDEGFVSLLTKLLVTWQDKTWNSPVQGIPVFDLFCAALVKLLSNFASSLVVVDAPFGWVLWLCPEGNAEEVRIVFRDAIPGLLSVYLGNPDHGLWTVGVEVFRAVMIPVVGVGVHVKIKAFQFVDAALLDAQQRKQDD
ncbi:hypothetical protein FIBSPDRAFT_1050598 [Athelia psychrophila]|uniref:Uncharacterized protein n=1 Tax=Athelia psychrophila TaxID=1759441 RepID=A0A166AJU6_9AGAM|nr:hypothetical protein FIBSPDRAFT_1050598 [Fibularhizoctonia sp. CBS 109695]